MTSSSLRHADLAGLTDSTVRVGPASYLTLHYRISLADSGADVVNTFGDKPATLQLGLGQMAEPLERCLLDLYEGDRTSFELKPANAYGERNPELIRKIARRTLDAANVGNVDYRPGDLVDFPAPDGGRYSGVLKQIDERYASIDFNHPLAGRAIRFEVQILGIL